eukprot:TRINITY_DN15397_c0_g2_i1.p2 TRINITY_DN15397_c0_g2~~TRINITY_DN15397_c0_g2_i1.p2  ORF type:complete len:100 (-),score=16.09 TRINITY_DN15397_c0_g2_i1:84-383(-)
MPAKCVFCKCFGHKTENCKRKPTPIWKPISTKRNKKESTTQPNPLMNLPPKDGTSHNTKGGSSISAEMKIMKPKEGPEDIADNIASASEMLFECESYIS